MYVVVVIGGERRGNSGIVIHHFRDTNVSVDISMPAMFWVKHIAALHTGGNTYRKWPLS